MHGSKSEHERGHEHGHVHEPPHETDANVDPEPIEFPPVNWLGFGIDMSATTPMDVDAATKHVVTTYKIIKYPGLNESGQDNRKVTVDGVLYSVPNAIRTGNDATFFSGNMVSYPDGTKARIEFETNPSLPSSYFAITGDPSVAEGTNKMFRRDNQYAFYAYTQGKYLASLSDYMDYLNVTSLKNRAQRMPAVFNGDDPECLKAYKEFFEVLGTHVIVKVAYGARFQMNLWASNDDPSVNNQWGNDVNYFFGGIPSGGKIYDPTVASQPQYYKFQMDLQRLISTAGGNQAAAATLAQDPTVYSNFTDWTDSLKNERDNVGRASILSMVVREIWTIMKLADDDVVNAYGRECQKAFTWIVSHPQLYKTEVVLDVQSDWAEFGLLTPSAVLIPGDDVPPLSELSTTKFRWGKEHSHQYERKTIKFSVINDGYPIDFYISHGSSGGGSSNGTAIVVMEGEEYTNNQITDNNWNTLRFYKARVSAKPEKFQLREVKGGHGKEKDENKRGHWDELLTQYLQEISRKE